MTISDSSDDSGESNANDDEIKLQNNRNIIIIGRQQPQDDDTQLESLLKRVYFEIREAIDIYSELRFIYEGQLYDLGMKMLNRSKDYSDPDKFCFTNWQNNKSLLASRNSDMDNQPTLVNILRDMRIMGVYLKSYGTKMVQGIDSSQHKIHFTASMFYNKLFIILQCIALAFYTSDVGSDLWLAFNYYSTGEMLFFGLTVCCVVIPSVITSYIAYLWSAKWDIFGHRKSDQTVILAGPRGEIELLLDKNEWSGRIHSAIAVVFSMFYR